MFERRAMDYVISSHVIQFSYSIHDFGGFKVTTALNSILCLAAIKPALCTGWFVRGELFDRTVVRRLDARP